MREILDKVSALNQPHTPPVEADDEYKKLKRKLNNHFLPKKIKHYARYTFSKQRMESYESIVAYAARMRKKARDCEFGDQGDDRILEHLIQTIKDNDLIKRCIKKRWNLEYFIEEGTQRKVLGNKSKI